MKKYLLPLLITSILVLLSACGNSNENSSETESASIANSTTTFTEKTTEQNTDLNETFKTIELTNIKLTISNQYNLTKDMWFSRCYHIGTTGEKIIDITETENDEFLSNDDYLDNIIGQMVDRGKSYNDFQISSLNNSIEILVYDYESHQYCNFWFDGIAYEFCSPIKYKEILMDAIESIILITSTESKDGSPSVLELNDRYYGNYMSIGISSEWKQEEGDGNSYHEDVRFLAPHINDWNIGCMFIYTHTYPADNEEYISKELNPSKDTVYENKNGIKFIRRENNNGRTLFNCCNHEYYISVQFGSVLSEDEILVIMDTFKFEDSPAITVTPSTTTTSTQTTDIPIVAEPPIAKQVKSIHFIVNTESNCAHSKPTCTAAKKISSENYLEIDIPEDELSNYSGVYWACGKCSKTYSDELPKIE